MQQPSVTRILVRTPDDACPRRLCNIVALKGSDGILYEYKVLFPGHNGFRMITGSVTSSIRGVIKQGVENWKSSNVEICYHSEGWLTRKNIDETSGRHTPHRWRATPFRKIDKASAFLRLCYMGVNQLNPYTKKHDFVLELPWKSEVPFSVDLFLTKKATRFSVSKKFIDSQQFILEDEENSLYLTLHFYRSENHDGNFIILLPRPFWVVLRDYIYEVIHNFTHPAPNH